MSSGKGKPGARRDHAFFGESVRAALTPWLAVQQLVALVAEYAQPRFLAFVRRERLTDFFLFDPTTDQWAHLNMPLKSSARSIERMHRKLYHLKHTNDSTTQDQLRGLFTEIREAPSTASPLVWTLVAYSPPRQPAGARIKWTFDLPSDLAWGEAAEVCSSAAQSSGPGASVVVDRFPTSAPKTCSWDSESGILSQRANPTVTWGGRVYLGISTSYGQVTPYLVVSKSLQTGVRRLEALPREQRLFNFCFFAVDLGLFASFEGAPFPSAHHVDPPLATLSICEALREPDPRTGLFWRERSALSVKLPAYSRQLYVHLSL
jgi:hypothetical protein